MLNHSLDVLTQTSEAAGIVKDVRKEMDAKQASIKKTRSGRERKAIYNDMKDLRKEYREREKQCVTTLVGGSKVVLATLHGAGGFQLRHEQFDVVIIDEASQALEAQCWIPLLTAKKVVLAGDHLQLPPTIKSTDHNSKPKPDKDKGGGGSSLETTLFDRLLSLHGPSIKRMLTTQYRMHEKIMRFPSDEMYDSRLVAAPAVAGRLLTSLPYEVQETDDTVEPLVFYDTQGGDFPEAVSDDATADAFGSGGGGGNKNKNKNIKSNGNGNGNNNGNDKKKKPHALSPLHASKSNPTEALLVAHHVRELIRAGVSPQDIAIITPYNAQLSQLSHLLHGSHKGDENHLEIDTTAVEISSIDSFQGREKEAIVLSLTRSNDDNEVGFLKDERRLNVAMTRARRHLCVVGDGGCVGGGGGGGFLERWISYLEAEAEVRYPDVGGLLGG